MTNTRLIEHAFEEFAQSLRVLIEADFSANHNGLLMVDRSEAVGNIENAFTSALNAFHSLYDATEKQLRASTIDWYGTGAIAIILAIRNARHHNKANRIRTLYTYHTQEAERIQHMEQYVLVDFPIDDEGADTFDLFISWYDLNLFLDLPEKESRIKERTCTAIRNYINTPQFTNYANHYELPESRVFINVIPLIVNAAGTVVPSIKTHCKGDSTESKFFSEHFATVVHADTKNHEDTCGPFVLPK